MTTNSLLGWVCIAAVVGVAIWAARQDGSTSGTGSAQAAATEARPVAPMPPLEDKTPVARVTVDELHDAPNRLAAVSRYDDKWIAVTGTVQATEQRLTDDVIIGGSPTALPDGTQIRSRKTVRCMLSEVSDAEKFRIGDIVTVTGRGSVREAMSGGLEVLLFECRVR